MKCIIQYFRQLNCNHENMEKIHDSFTTIVYRCPKCLYVQKIKIH